MPGLTLYTGNRLEDLADRLAGVVGKPLGSPLAPEVIVVQSVGMQRWISMELARRLGVWAHCSFRFPNDVVDDLFRSVLPDAADGGRFEREVLAWRVMAKLPACMGRPGFESLRDYIRSGEDRSLRQWRLAERIAYLFDQYVIFRPGMVLGWEEGEGDGWQAALWRLLARDTPGAHRAAFQRLFFERVRAGGVRTEDLPERLSVFGISALPKFHMDVLAASSSLLDVNIFLMNPSRRYWADIRNSREIRRVLGRGGYESLAPEDLHLEKGNSLLASMGMLGRDFLWLLMSYDGMRDEQAFADREDAGDPPSSLLGMIQHDILDLLDRGAPGGEEDTVPFGGTDGSIVIGSCHGPMREVEALHDYLLGLFAADPTLEPRDILVMAPEIEVYVPFIQAVFGNAPDESRNIPFSIADRSVRSESGLVDAFMAVLDCAGGRLGAGRVLDLLQSEDVRRRFGFDEGVAELARRWVAETGIRWGIDAADRERRGLPAIGENTWRHGLDRLLLGYAMPGRGEALFEGILPYDHVEGSEAQALGRFLRFVETLFGWMNALNETRGTEEWSGVLCALMDAFFETDASSASYAAMLKAELSKLREAGALAGFGEAVELPVVKAWLENALRDRRVHGHFLTGGVTFCAMLPMRSVPFRVICLIGMNDDVFPRRSSSLGFDLMAQRPRPGDRSLRTDDRYIFLEAIVSARDKLYLSYVGQSAQDDSAIPSSVLVSELLDYVEQACGMPAGGVREKLVTRHRLQPFSPSYFTGGGLHSYSRENLEACRALLSERIEPAGFVPESFPEPEPFSEVFLHDMLRFFRNPARFLLNRRLRLRFDEYGEEVEESEPFDVSSRDRRLLTGALCDRALEGGDVRGLYETFRAAGGLPHGNVGRAAFRSLAAGVPSFVREVRSRRAGGGLPPCEVQVGVGEYALRGRIDGVWKNTLLSHRYAKANAKDLLDLWIRHLALNAAGARGYPKRSAHVASDKVVEFRPVEEAEAELEKLVRIYARGLRELIPFFPETSRVFAEQIAKEKTPEDALEAARREWGPSDFGWSEARDDYFDLCFNKVDPLAGEFGELALAVYKPLLEHRDA